MKLLFLVNSLKAGGAEKQTMQLCNELHDSGWEITCFYFFGESIEFDFTTQYVNPKSYRLLSAANKISNIINDNEYDGIITVNQYPLLIGWLANKLANKQLPIAQVFHTTELKNNYERVKMLFYKKLFEQVNLVVFVSENQQKHWKSKLKLKKSVVIQNGIPTESPVVYQKNEVGNNDFTFGISAMLRPEKNHLFLLGVFAQLVEKVEVNVKLLIIGSGPMEAEIKEEVQKLNLSRHVTFTGFVSAPEQEILHCDCMLLVSDSVETFSLSNLESMAMNKPIIASDIGGASEQIIPAMTGYLFEKNNQLQLLNHMSNCASNKQHCEEMGGNARAFLIDNFTEGKMFEKYKKTFLNL